MLWCHHRILFVSKDHKGKHNPNEKNRRSEVCFKLQVSEAGGSRKATIASMRLICVVVEPEHFVHV